MASRQASSRTAAWTGATLADQPAARRSPSNTTLLTLSTARWTPIAAHSGARPGAVRAATSVRPKTVSSTRYASGSCPAGVSPTGGALTPSVCATPACTTVDAAGTSRNTAVVPRAETAPPNRSRNEAQA